MSSELFYTFLLGILPVSEARGAILYGTFQGIPILEVLFFSLLANLLGVVLIFLILDYLHKHLIKFKVYNKLFNKSIKRTRHKIENKVGTKAELIALILFVAIPLPFTGGYTGTLLAWFFNIKRKKAILGIFIGISISAIFVTLVSLGILSFF